MYIAICGEFEQSLEAVMFTFYGGVSSTSQIPFL
jgi:hypothetical protein